MSGNSSLPLLDSLAHPTLSGTWLGRSTRADFEKLSGDLQSAGFMGACAIGLDGVDEYAHEAFVRRCHQTSGLIPIAGFNPGADAGFQSLKRLRDMGYVGVKVHPRFSGLTRSIEKLGPALRAAGEAGLTVFFCTYMHCGIKEYPARDPFFSLVALLEEAPDTRVVLVHGGDVQIMRYAELVRFNNNLLLDLSMTIMKYAGSSVDLDIGFLFRQFDRRICIGTDWPEYSPDQLRTRFDLFSEGLSEDKLRNIAYRNLLGFLGLEDEFGHLHATDS